MRKVYGIRYKVYGGILKAQGGREWEIFKVIRFNIRANVINSAILIKLKYTGLLPCGKYFKPQNIE